MAQSETDQMADVRIPIGVAIVLQVIIAAAYIIPIESDPALSTEPRFRLLEAALYLSPLLTLALYQLAAAGRALVCRGGPGSHVDCQLFFTVDLPVNSGGFGSSLGAHRPGRGNDQPAGSVWAGENHFSRAGGCF